MWIKKDFKNAIVCEEVYGLTFGKGKITKVFDDNSYFKIIVEFENGYEIPYTEDGIPNWGNIKSRTLFYKEDVDLTNVDFKPNLKPLSYKKLIKLREKNKLEIQLPSGLWIDYFLSELEYREKLLANEKIHMFRKKRTQKK
jgi:hypothetical protein